jgi:hypothetical protein
MPYGAFLEKLRELLSLRFVAGLLGIFLVLGAVSAEAGKKKPRTLPPPPADLPGHVNYLVRQLYAVPLDESEPVTSQVQKLVTRHLEEWLPGRMANPNPSDVPLDVQVRRELENEFSQLHYPFFGQPAVFAESWKGGVLVGAGYTLGWSDYDRVNVMALFESRDGKTRLAAITNFVPRTDLHYEFLRASSNDDFRFFTYGTRLGKSHPRLTAILYSFDGKTLRPLWETHDVYDGKMEVGREKVVIRYLREEEYIREIAEHRHPPRHEAAYEITPQGLELETDHEIPF